MVEKHQEITSQSHLRESWGGCDTKGLTTGLRLHVIKVRTTKASKAPPRAPPTAPPTRAVSSAGQSAVDVCDKVGSSVLDGADRVFSEVELVGQSTKLPMSNVSVAVELAQQFSLSSLARQQNWPPGLHWSIFQVSTSAPPFHSSLPVFSH